MQAEFFGCTIYDKEEPYYLYNLQKAVNRNCSLQQLVLG